MSAGFEVLTWAQFQTLELPPIRWIVKDVIPSGSISLLVAPPKAGKSLLTIDLACSIAADEPFLDREVCGGRVLLMPAEDNLLIVRDRISTRLGAQDAPIFTAPINGQPINGQKHGRTLKLGTEESLKDLVATIKEVNPSLVIIDPLREVHEGAENDSDDMAPLLRPLRKITQDTDLDVSILVVHHAGWTGHSRGSTAILGAVDQIITFKRDGDDDSEVIRGRLKIDGRHGPKFSVPIEFGNGGKWIVSDMVRTEPENARDRILWALDGAAHPLTADQIVERLGGLNKKTVQNCLADIRKDTPDLLVRDGRGTRGSSFTYSLVGSNTPPDSPFRPDLSGNNGNQLGASFQEAPWTR